MSALPPGFVLDEPTPAEAGASAALPPGFVLDAPQAQEPPPPPQRQPGIAEDVVRSVGSGLARGIAGLIGLPADLSNAAFRVARGGVNIARGKDFGYSEPTAYDRAQASGDAGLIPQPTAANVLGGMEGVAGPFYEPKTTAGQYARTAAEFVPGAVIVAPAGAVRAVSGFVPGAAPSAATGSVRNALQYGVAPGLASEGAGQAAQAIAPDYEAAARIAGGVVGALGAAGATRAVTPNPAPAGRTAAANALRQEGVEVTAGQATGSRPLQWMETTLGDMPMSGRAAGAIADRQREQFTAAVLRRAGIDAPRATPDVIDGAFGRIGQQFDDLAARNAAQVDNQLVADLRAARNEYNTMVGANSRSPAVDAILRDVADAATATGGVIPGEVYQAFRSRVDRMARSARADPQLSDALLSIRNAIDDAMERSITQQDAAAWAEARRQYRNMLVIEKAATAGGENAASGLISPQQLRMQVAAQNRRAYARGQGDFAGLARAGSEVMPQMPQSGTQPRMAAQGVITAGGGALGALAAGQPGVAAGIIGGAVAPGILGRLLMSGPAQRYLGNQMLADEQVLPAAIRGVGSTVPQAPYASERPARR